MQSTYFKSPFIFYSGNMDSNYLVFRFRSKAAVFWFVFLFFKLGPYELSTSIHNLHWGLANIQKLKYNLTSFS